MALLLDTGVIWSFAAAKALHLLRLAAGQLDLKATKTVANELGVHIKQERHLLEAVRWDCIDWIDPVTEIGGGNRTLEEIEHLREEQFAIPGDSPNKHLGESEMIVIARHAPTEWILAFEDADARRYCVIESLTLVTTIDLLTWAHAEGAPCDEIVGAYEAMLDAGRKLPSGMKASDLCA